MSAAEKDDTLQYKRIVIKCGLSGLCRTEEIKKEVESAVVELSEYMSMCSFLFEYALSHELYGKNFQETLMNCADKNAFLNFIRKLFGSLKRKNFKKTALHGTNKKPYFSKEIGIIIENFKEKMTNRLGYDLELRNAFEEQLLQQYCTNMMNNVTVHMERRITKLQFLKSKIKNNLEQTEEKPKKKIEKKCEKKRTWKQMKEHWFKKKLEKRRKKRAGEKINVISARETAKQLCIDNWRWKTNKKRQKNSTIVKTPKADNQLRKKVVKIGRRKKEKIYIQVNHDTRKKK